MPSLLHEHPQRSLVRRAPARNVADALHRISFCLEPSRATRIAELVIAGSEASHTRQVRAEDVSANNLPRLRRVDELEWRAAVKTRCCFGFLRACPDARSSTSPPSRRAFPSDRGSGALISWVGGLGQSPTKRVNRKRNPPAALHPRRHNNLNLTAALSLLVLNARSFSSHTSEQNGRSQP